MIVTTSDDASNADLFTGGSGGPTIPEWRLVPHDNNIAQRNVFPVPAAGLDDAATALDGAWFRVCNPGRLTTTIMLDVRLPELLEQRGWRLGFEGEGRRFQLQPRERRRVFMTVTRGRPYTRAEVEATTDRDILVTAHADGTLIGGMTYRLDPEIARATYQPRRDGKRKGSWWQLLVDRVRSLLMRLGLVAGTVQRR